MTKHLNMNFFGVLSLAPKVGSLEVCKAFGQTLYIEPGKYNNPHFSEPFCPAWLITEEVPPLTPPLPADKKAVKVYK